MDLQKRNELRRRLVDLHRDLLEASEESKLSPRARKKLKRLAEKTVDLVAQLQADDQNSKSLLARILKLLAQAAVIYSVLK